MKLKATTIILCSLLSAQAWAFGLTDHKQIMLAAIDEMNACFPGTIDSLSSKILWASDLEEDINVFRKDLIYSHYYNPEKELTDLTRLNSAVRVKVADVELQYDAATYGKYDMSTLIDLGHISHHIQDMAAPPHVVPVDHGYSDAFEEKYDVLGRLHSGYSCEQIRQFAQTESYQQVHKNNAMMTLALVRNTPVPVTIHTPGRPDVRMQMSSTNFWLPSVTATFGQYGFFGNHFGETEINVYQTRYSVPDEYYENYKRQFLNLGVQGTVKALSLFYLR